MVPAAMIAVSTNVCRGRVLLVLRTAAITELALTEFSGRLCLMYLSHVNRADFYAGHTA
jgi:hypothetical protein